MDASKPRNPKDQAAWFLKCRALTSKQWIDDVEPPGTIWQTFPILRSAQLTAPFLARIDEEGVADLLLDENAVAQARLQRKAQDAHRLPA